MKYEGWKSLNSAEKYVSGKIKADSQKKIVNSMEHSVENTNSVSTSPPLALSNSSPLLNFSNTSPPLLFPNLSPPPAFSNSSLPFSLTNPPITDDRSASSANPSTSTAPRNRGVRRSATELNFGKGNAQEDEQNPAKKRRIIFKKCQFHNCKFELE